MGIALACYRPHRWTDIGGRVIAAWTRSPYSHCEIVIDGLCYTSSIRDGGVRVKRIDTSAQHWDVIPITWASADAAQAVFRQMAGLPYGWLDLIGQHVLRLPITGRGVICSELCAAMLLLPRPESYSPGALAEYAMMRSAAKL